MIWRRIRDATELGRSLAEIRLTRGMSQQDLADWLDVDRTTVVRLESGSLRALSRLTEALSVLGADLVVVPRGARVTVTARDDDQDGAQPGEQDPEGSGT